MRITRYQIDQLYEDYRNSSGGNKNDYFGLLYLEQAYNLSREKALRQLAFGGNDYGIDGFHFDPQKRNFYLLQFKFTKDHLQFKGSFQRLIADGIEQIFAAKTQDTSSNQILAQIKSQLRENRSVIDQVCLYFVFDGDPEEAGRSKVLDQLREELENKRYLIDQFFGRPIQMVIEFRTPEKVGPPPLPPRNHTYTIGFEGIARRTGPGSETMHIGFVSLADLLQIQTDMGNRFLERNIRAALPEDVAVNKALSRAYRRILLDSTEGPEIFAFNHNGMSIAAQDLQPVDGMHSITEPRLLNGAQTLATLGRFMEKTWPSKAPKEAKERLSSMMVLCKIITGGEQPFVTSVTVNNNRQNPIAPWNLRANDLIQLHLQDKFKQELGVFYERQENAMAALSDAELEEEGLDANKAVEIRRLAQTYLAVDGDVDRMNRLKEVFEDDRLYAETFAESRLQADFGKTLMCYKAQFRLGRIANCIVERGPNKYGYVSRARNMLWALLCQAMLNSPDCAEQAEAFGQKLVIEQAYTDWLTRLASNQCRLILSALTADNKYADKVAEGNYGFLRTNAAYKLAIEYANTRFHWVRKGLR